MVLKDLNPDNGVNGYDDIDSPPPVNVAECNDDNQEIVDIYRAEIHRRDSFLGWPKGEIIDPNILAENGFFYLGDGDRVKCVFCLVVLKNWEIGDVVKDEHTRFSPNCPFLLGMAKGNIPYCQSPDELKKKAKLQQYARTEDRLKTYENWPKALKQRPQQLAAAGFYYTGQGDNVQCFMCGGMLKNWEETDEPWTEHKHWFPLCLFVQENDPRHAKGSVNRQIKKSFKRSLSSGAIAKGYSKELIKIYQEYKKKNQIPQAEDLEHFIQELEQFKIQNDTQPHSPPEDLTSSLPISLQQGGASNVAPPKEQKTTGKRTPDEDRFLCTICMERERQITFLPCNHFVTCKECSKKVKECPVCRERIRGTQRTYLN